MGLGVSPVDARTFKCSHLNETPPSLTTNTSNVIRLLVYEQTDQLCCCRCDFYKLISMAPQKSRDIRKFESYRIYQMCCLTWSAIRRSRIAYVDGYISTSSVMTDLLDTPTRLSDSCMSTLVEKQDRTVSGSRVSFLKKYCFHSEPFKLYSTYKFKKKITDWSITKAITLYSIFIIPTYMQPTTIDIYMLFRCC